MKIANEKVLQKALTGTRYQVPVLLRCGTWYQYQYQYQVVPGTTVASSFRKT